MMDYTEAELEARIFPSVDLDPRDWEEDCEEQDNEPYEDGSWMDENALASAGFGNDEDYGGYDGDDY
jgi:hypothetical protein